MGYYVYKHTSPSGKIYIGITHQRPTKRWGSGTGYEKNTHFYRAIRKYGWHNFTHEIICEGLSKEEARSKEIELIAFYDSTNRTKGYNISPGGDSPGEDTQDKIRTTREARGVTVRESERMKRQWENPDYRDRVLRNMRGKVRSPESRERYRQAVLRRGAPKPESIEKMREALRQYRGEKSFRKRPVLQIAPVTLEIVGRYWTATDAAAAVGASTNGVSGVCRREGTRVKAGYGYFWCYEDEYDPDYFEQYRGVSFTSSGKFPREGERASGTSRVWSEESRRKVGEKHSRSVLCVETGEVFPSIRSAAQKFGVDGSAIGRCLRGKAETSCGFHWKYADEISTPA